MHAWILLLHPSPVLSCRLVPDPEWTGWGSDKVARWWQDGFTEGADAEYVEQILPMAAAPLSGAARVLDVGCGEGQVSRRAVGGGATRVVGVDPTWAQIAVARARGGGPSYGQG